jgi:hypothetical protein
MTGNTSHSWAVQLRGVMFSALFRPGQRRNSVFDLPQYRAKTGDKAGVG